VSTTSPPATLPRILVVDDEMGPRESLRMLLKPSYQIATADSGRGALEQIPTFHPDLVIMDIKMPEMDGLEVLRRIKHSDPSIEVVMITAYASLETVKTALTYGAFEYLIKPFSRKDLEDCVRRAVLRRQKDVGARGQVAGLVEEMRRLAAKTRELEEAARRETAGQSLRVTQLSILREISRTIVGELDPQAVSGAITDHVRAALGYDQVMIAAAPPGEPDGPCLITCPIRDVQGPLGQLVVDNRRSGRAIDPLERDLLEMLSEYLAIALRNSRLYGEIADTKRSLEQLIASAGDAIIAVSAGGRIEGWNPAAERIFASSAGETINRAITDILPAGDYQRARARLAAGAAMDAFETTTAVDGRPVALAVTLSALRGRSGSLDGLIAIVRDITLQREAESRLHQAEKLTALGQLAGGISHDFNNLLQPILGYLQLVKQNPDNRPLLERSLRIMESAAVDGAETVRRIQQFARLRPDEQFVSVDVNQIVQNAAAITQPRWAERIAHDSRTLDLRLNLTPVPAIHGRPAGLTELMTNLILNAMDAMPEGGVLTVDTRPETASVVIVVRDTGIGMSDAVRRRIFEPFFSTKGEGGSGLGLSMAYSIVERHGGDIAVESEPGRGTTFTLRFPVAPAPSPPSAALGDGARGRRARVLVVDDEPQVLSTLVDLLESVGHVPTSSTSASDALAAYAPGTYDIVLSNIGMVGMNGWEFVERLRRVDPGVPVVFITGWGLRDQEQARLAALNISRCLFKPLGAQDLDSAIQSALAPTR
jgi:PAS domain S-box-containing protein